MRRAYIVFMVEFSEEKERRRRVVLVELTEVARAVVAGVGEGCPLVSELACAGNGCVGRGKATVLGV